MNVRGKTVGNFAELTNFLETFLNICFTVCQKNSYNLNKRRTAFRAKTLGKRRNQEEKRCLNFQLKLIIIMCK